MILLVAPARVGGNLPVPPAAVGVTVILTGESARVRLLWSTLRDRTPTTFMYKQERYVISLMVRSGSDFTCDTVLSASETHLFFLGQCCMTHLLRPAGKILAQIPTPC